MEDAHVAVTETKGDTEVGIFGVFDGHGGAEVAKFCQRHFAAELRSCGQFQKDQVGEGLIQVFHRIDEMLRDEKFSQELDALRGARTGGDNGPGPPPSGAAAALSAQSAASGNASVEQQQTLDVMKRILEIKRMVTEGAGNGGQQNGPGGSDAKAADNGEAKGGSLDRAAAESGENEQCGQVGCTAVVAVLKGRELYVANAGDSRAVLGRGATAVALSEDHKPASPTERNRITAAGGFVSEVGGVTRVNGNLNLSRAIGDLRYKANSDLPVEAQIITAQPDVRRVALTPEDRFFLLACDGVWDVMTNQQAVDFINQRLDQDLSAGAICAEILDTCLAKNPKEARGIGCDNMTAELIVFK